jgi:hypothetical protein
LAGLSQPAFPFTAALPGDESNRNGPGEIAMHAVIDLIRSFFASVNNWPHHLALYITVGAVAVLLVALPLIRAIFGSRDTDDTASPSTLGLTSAVVEFKPAPVIEFTPHHASKVTAINEAHTVPCIHCGVTISTREDFCPACGYAQPVKQSFIAAFPA